MKKLDINKYLEGLKSPKFLINAAFITLFAIIITGILVSKYFFFQTIVGNDNASKVMVTAPANIEVIDSIKTEKRKREVAQKVNFVYTPADDTYIKNNLNEIIEEIKQIRANNEISESDKKSRLEAMFDMPDSNIKAFVFSFFLNASDEDLDNVTISSANTLEAVLNEGITEKDFEENSLAKIIRRNVEVNTTNNNIKVITALLEQVIVPNMIVDEEATETARKIERDKVSPIIVKFDKGDVIVNVGEPITQVKKEALSKAGYNILRINYFGILGILCLVGTGIFAVLYYIKSFEQKFLDKRHMLIVAVLSIFMAICAVLLPSNWSVFLLPFPFYAMILSVFLNPRSSFYITVTLLTIITLSLQLSALAMSVFLLSVIISTIGMTTIRYSRRFDLIKVGVYISVTMLLIILCVYYDLGIGKLGRDILSGVVNGFFSGVLALGMIPILEK